MGNCILLGWQREAFSWIRCFKTRMPQISSTNFASWVRGNHLEFKEISISPQMPCRCFHRSTERCWR